MRRTIRVKPLLLSQSTKAVSGVMERQRIGPVPGAR